MSVLHEELAKIVVGDSLKVDADDAVIVTTWDHTIDVANAIAVQCFKHGADVMMNLWTDDYYYGLLRELSSESLSVCSKLCQAFSEAETATVNLFGPKNPEGLKGVDPSKVNAWGKGEREAHYPRNIERKIRNVVLPLALLTPERAKVYGFDLRKWEKTVNSALTMDLKKIAAKGKALDEILAKAHKAHLTASNGTDLTFELAKRIVHVDDGIIDELDIKNKSLDAQLPAGSVLTTVVETSADGRVVFDRPLQSMGLNVQGIEWKFKDGKLTSMRAEKNFELLAKQYKEASGDKDMISFVQVGLNPKAEYGYLMDHIVDGAVQIGIGDNEYIGGKNTSTFGMAATIGKATLEIDGNTIIRNGQLTTKC